ncbi:MAG: hypothetical protein FJ358_05640 [Thaumarchaeota archaeon]|nr:hypothetical protein [Nitrososphaerota archaeon]
MKIVGAMQVGGNCEWILPKSLKNLSLTVDEVVVVGRGFVSDETERIVRSIPNVALADLIKGKSTRIEWNDMNLLLKMALQRKADWILFMDSDETFEPRLRKEIRELTEHNDVGLYTFKKYWLWKNDRHYRVDRPDKFLSYAFNTYLVRASTKLRFPNPAGPFLKRLAKHLLGKERLRPYFGRNPVQGVEGKRVNTDIILLHHAAVNWNHFVKNQIWYASLIAKREPKRDEYSIAEQLYSILDESTLKLEPVRPEWIG